MVKVAATELRGNERINRVRGNGRLTDVDNLCFDNVITILCAGAESPAKKKKKETTTFDPNRPVPSDAVLKQRLKAEEYFVVRQGGTQTPFQNDFWNNDRTGIYVDVITNEPLFTSLDKYDAQIGMPSFS